MGQMPSQLHMGILPPLPLRLAKCRSHSPPVTYAFGVHTICMPWIIDASTTYVLYSVPNIPTALIQARPWVRMYSSTTQSTNQLMDPSMYLSRLASPPPILSQHAECNYIPPSQSLVNLTKLTRLTAVQSSRMLKLCVILQLDKTQPISY